MIDTPTTFALLSDLADEAGVGIEYVHAGQRRWRLLQRGRGTRAFASAKALECELEYLASLRRVVANFKALNTPEAWANPDSAENWALYNAAIGKEA